MNTWQFWSNTDSDLGSLASKFRALQLFAHIAHNNTTGISFHADHEFFGELYEAYEEVYDSVVERMIGLGMSPDLFAIANNANTALQGMKDAGVQSYYAMLLTAEKAAQESAESAMNDNQTEATKNLLAQIADDSEQRQYKIQQRIK